MEWETGNGTKKDETVYNPEKTVNQTEISVDKLDFDPGVAEKSGKSFVNQLRENENNPTPAGRTDSPSGGKPARMEESVLSAQLERMDRAAPVPAGLGPVRREGRAGEYPRPLPGPYAGISQPLETRERVWAGGEAGQEGRSAPGGDLLLAERADQAFRRDSRRYDGSFYLY